MFSIPLSVKRDITIQKDQQKVFSALSSFETWKFWSPWVCQEPACLIELSGVNGQVGHMQKWDGNVVGTGQMTITGLEHSKRIDYQLEFLKPWKSKAKVSFFLEAYDDSTHVTWSMDSRIPFFLFFMRKQMEHYIAFDYSRGLNMLKEWLENGKVSSFSEVKGVSKKAKTYYIGKRRQCALIDLSKFMETDFTDLASSEKKGVLPHPDEILSLYHDFDIINGVCDYTACYAYQSPQAAINKNSSLISGEVPEHNAFQVDHTGAYRHIANAWTTALNNLRVLKLKKSMAFPMYEIYKNLPSNTEEADLKTQIMIPIAN